MESADRGVQRIQRRDVSRCNEKRGMAGRSTGQKTMEEKKSKAFLADGKKHAEAQSTNHKKERICSLNHPPLGVRRKIRSKSGLRLKYSPDLSGIGRMMKTTVGYRDSEQMSTSSCDLARSRHEHEFARAVGVASDGEREPVFVIPLLTIDPSTCAL